MSKVREGWRDGRTHEAKVATIAMGLATVGLLSMIGVAAWAVMQAAAKVAGVLVP